MNDLLGQIHFWGSFICINLVFMPMFIQGLGGLNRRMYDGGATYMHNAGLLKWNLVIAFAAWGLGLFQLPFIVNFFRSMKWGTVVDRNPANRTSGGDQLYFTDPDGTRVQLSANGYQG